MTGIYAPTDGTAYIYNRDVRYEYNQIRKYVGICPQHDVLFNDLTVKEHLRMFAVFKGVDNAIIETEINKILQDVHMTVQTAHLRLLGVIYCLRN